MTTESETRQLATNIYNKRARVNEGTSIETVGVESPKQKRLKELDIAAQFAALALGGYK